MQPDLLSQIYFYFLVLMADVSACPCSKGRVNLRKMKPRIDLPFRAALYGDNLCWIHLCTIGMRQNWHISDVWLTKREEIIPGKF